MKNIKAVIFDLDDTLLRSQKIKWAHHKTVAKRFYDYEITDEMLREHWGKPHRLMLQLLYGDVDEPENVMKRNEETRHEFSKEIYDGTLDILEFLRSKQIHLGIVTSSTGELTKQDLERLNVSINDFLFIHGEENTPAHKPDPRVFEPGLRLLEKKGIHKDQIVYVGDSLHDFYAARDAGMNFVGITTGLVTKEAFQEAKVTHIIGELAQLKLILDR